MAVMALALTASPVRADAWDALIPYRVIVGASETASSFATTRPVTKTVERQETPTSPPVGAQVKRHAICTESQGSKDFGGADPCDTGGFDTYLSPTRASLAVETRPTYFWLNRGRWFGVGFSTLLNSAEGRATLVDYPLDQERTKVEFSAWSLAPALFVLLGNPRLGADGGFSVRVGAVPLALLYVERFRLTRMSTGERFQRRGYYLQSSQQFQQDAHEADREANRDPNGGAGGGPTAPGAFVEISWGPFYLRRDSFLVGFKGQKFTGVEPDTFIVSSGPVVAGFAIYF